MSEWNYMSILRLLFQWNSTTKIKLSRFYIGLEQSEPHHIYLIEKELVLTMIYSSRKIAELQ
jgi:hypothetical protein